MSALFKKPSIANRQMDRIQKDVANVNADICYLERSLPTANPSMKPPVGEGDYGATFGPFSSVDKEPSELGRAARVRASLAERFPDFVAGSFESTRPLRHERRLQRNRAVVTLVFLGLVAFMMIFRFI